MKNNWDKVQKVLKASGVAVIPTDTLYGMVGSAYSKNAVEKVYKIKGRDEGKPCIVLISKFSDLEKFGVNIPKEQNTFLQNIWPGKVSVILPCTDKKFQYLHRGTKTIAFRMIGPRNRNLYKLLNNVGPLVAPSANPQGSIPASSVWEAEKYFGNKVDIYACGHTRKSLPSTLITFLNNKPKVLRKGAVSI